jgi:hypothetical protein
MDNLTQQQNSLSAGLLRTQEAGQAVSNPLTAAAAPAPLHEMEGQFHAMLIWKIAHFFEWLRGIEAALDREGMNCNVHVVYASPFTPGGPFIQVPTAVVTAEVLYKGFVSKTAASGRENERRGVGVSLQNMMAWSPDDHERAASIIAHTLRWYSKPESYFFPEE